MSEIKNETSSPANQIDPNPVTTDADLVATETKIGSEASLGQRCGAYLIDVLIAIGLTFITSKLGSISNVIGMAYILTKDALPFLDGQSIGKKALGLKAVTQNGESPSGNWNPGLIRNAVLLIPFFPLVELIVLLTKKDSPEGLLRLGDQWAKTKVLNIGK